MKKRLSGAGVLVTVVDQSATGLQETMEFVGQEDGDGVIVINISSINDDVRNIICNAIVCASVYQISGAISYLVDFLANSINLSIEQVLELVALDLALNKSESASKEGLIC